MGALTAVGEGADALWNAAVEGRSGISVLDVAAASGQWKVPAAFVHDFSPEKFITQRKSLKVMSRDIQLAVAGATLAFNDSNIKDSGFNHERFGTIIGSGVLNYELDELAYSVQNSLDESGQMNMHRFGADGLSSLFPLWLLKYLPNMPACHISILFDLQGINNTITTGASAGLQAVGEAMRIIQRNDADVMIAGGADSKVNPVGLSHFKVLGALSDPSSNQADHRPFDRDSRGFVVGEGAGFLILEELEHAKKRGAKIYAELVGFGSSTPEGRTVAMHAALKDAGLAVSDLQYLQASALGVKEEDTREAQAIYDVFNGSGKNLSVSGSKAVVGFTGFSAGALDLIISVEALRKQIVPPVLNFSEGEKDWGFQIVKGKAQPKKMQYAMTNTFGFNGQAVSAITKVYGEK